MHKQHTSFSYSNPEGQEIKQKNMVGLLLKTTQSPVIWHNLASCVSNVIG